MSGEAANYYKMGDKGYAPPQGPPPTEQGQQQYQQYQQNQINNQQYQNEQQAQYAQPPPNYGNQNYGPTPGAFETGQEKPTFAQAFKIEKPRYNDWWAGLLLLAVFAGFVAVSGLSISSYGMRTFLKSWMTDVVLIVCPV